jgi:putative nucleotidyltransferase with HDIG domain
MEKYRFLLRERLASYREWVDGRRSRQFTLVLFACLVVGLAIVIATAYMPWLYGFEAGKTAPRTVIASETITVLDNQATNDLKDYVGGLVEPAYVPDTRALAGATIGLETFFAVAGQLRGELGQGLIPQEAVAQLGVAAPATVSDATLSYLLTTNSDSYDLVLKQAVGSLKPVFAQQIANNTLDAARQRLRSIVEALTMSPEGSTAVYEVASGFIRTNQMIDQEQTLARRQAAMEEIAPVAITVPKGQQVIKKGELVTPQDALVLGALGVTQTRSGWKVWLGVFLVCLLEGTVFFLLLRRFNKSTGLSNIMLLALVSLMLGFTVVARFLILHPLSPYLIPVAGLGMLVAIILNARSAFLMVVLLSLNVGLLTDLQMRYGLVSIIVGGLAVYLVSRVVQRAALLGAGALVMVIAAFTTFGVELFREAGVGVALRVSMWGLSQGLLAWVSTVLLLLILDLVFNLNTPLRLLELANPAQPLLKKLLQVAPGTYNHSILMGNLAEAAAESIGADPLLARVGAYYHDIGKTIRPEYFVENQIYVDNPHDRLSPNLSKLAIAAHVRDGEHLAKLHGLPAPVIDIIKQHHGTSVLAFFYHKAKEASLEPVDEESYRYEEEKPHSKEAAIIMLADGTEAAVRAMQHPTRRKIQGVIQEVFKQRIQDGQLDESDLTLGDLHKIQESFDTSLRGLVGHRIRYPEKNDQNERRAGRAANGEASPIDLPGGAVAHHPRLRVPPSAAALRTQRPAPPAEGPESGGASPGDG